MLGSGFYNSNGDFPSFFTWINYISPYKYMLEIMYKTQADFNDITRIVPEKLGYENGLPLCYLVLSSMFGFFLIIEYPFLYLYARHY